jgi:hypothetical protein
MSYVYGGFGTLPTNLALQFSQPASVVTPVISAATPGAVTPLSMLAKRGVQISLARPQLSPAAAAAMMAAAGAKQPSTPAIVPFAPAKSTPVPGTKSVVTEQAFAEACKRDLNGTVVAFGICRAPDGAEITVDGTTGQPKCRNQVGMCSPAAQAAAAQAAATTTSGSKAIMIGAAALAALMLLR